VYKVLKEFVQRFSSFLSCGNSGVFLECIIKEHKPPMYNLMYQVYFAATCFSYPQVPIIRLQIRSIKRKLFTHNLTIVINIRI